MLREASTSTTSRPCTFCTRSLIHCGCSANSSAAGAETTRSAISVSRAGADHAPRLAHAERDHAANAGHSRTLTQKPPGLAKRMLEPKYCTLLAG